MSDEQDELGKLKQEIQQTREKVFQLAKLAEMGKLVAVVAHELSQPLLGIKAFAQILRSRYREDEFVEPKVRMIEEQALHMEGILDSLRRYSKPTRLTRSRVAPLAPVQAAVELFRDRARKLRVQIEISTPNGDMPEVLCSQGHLQQIVVNLVGNALDELEGRGGTIRVILEPDDEGLRLRVADTGSGIAADLASRLFEPFFTTKGAEKGTGLGLSICKDIVETYNGSIRLLPTEEARRELGDGTGAVFEVRLRPAPQF